MVSRSDRNLIEIPADSEDSELEGSDTAGG